MGWAAWVAWAEWAASSATSNAEPAPNANPFRRPPGSSGGREREAFSATTRSGFAALVGAARFELAIFTVSG